MPVVSISGSIGQRVLCLFLGTHLSFSSAKVAVFELIDPVISTAAASAAVTPDTNAIWPC